MPKFVTVPRLWPGATVVCIASGCSLTQADVDAVHGRARVIVVNDNYKLAPWADVLYAADAHWWTTHKGVPHFQGLKYAITKASAAFTGVQVLQRKGTDGLSLDPARLATGSNSGYQAVNLAVHLGASRIVLLGYDMQAGPGGKEHWFGDHPWRSKSPYKQFQRAYPTLVAPLRSLGIEIVNCTRQTALTCFPRMALGAVFPAQVEAVA